MMTKYRYKQLVAIALLLLLTGCSTSYNTVSQSGRDLPAIPEVSRPVVVKPKARIAPPRKSTLRPRIRSTVQRRSTATVRKYSVQRPKPADVVITQKDIAAVNKALLEEESNNTASVDIDPYASIPENSTAVVSTYAQSDQSQVTTSTSSPVLKALLVTAQADLSVGNTTSAISKLERGLRIAPNDSKLWATLARAHFEQTDYQNAISMAKKSIRYSRNDDAIAKNWALIKKAGLKSGDTSAVKEAINYSKINP